MIESSTRTRFPSRMLRTGFSLTRTPKWRIDCCGSMNVRFDVVIADEPHPHRMPDLSEAAPPRTRAGVRDRHDDVGIDRGFARENASSSSAPR